MTAGGHRPPPQLVRWNNPFPVLPGTIETRSGRRKRGLLREILYLTAQRDRLLLDSGIHAEV